MTTTTPTTNTGCAPARGVLASAQLAVSAVPQAGEDFMLFASDAAFAERTASIAARCDALLVALAGSREVDAVMERVEQLREQANRARDAARGLSSQVERVLTTTTGTATATATATTTTANNNNNNNKPQTAFFDYPVDNSRAPFRPKLRVKPFSVVPLQVEPEVSSESALAGFFRNPYEEEIRHALEHDAPDWLWSGKPKFAVRMRSRGKGSGDSLESTPFALVSSVDAFEDMLAHLTSPTHEAIAVDLEHHSLRSFQGFTCVMQISTVERDFVVDALALREHLSRLLPVFANPKVVKVLHGADHDVEWLQRDFGLYVVQLFDTGQAARVLGYDSASLAFALNRHVNVVANKSYQLVDWRVRPLPKDYVKYAREDTHFLLSVFDLMRLELVRGGEEGRMDSVRTVLERSADIAMKTFEKTVFSPRGYMDLLLTPGEFDPTQLHVLSALYEWRDRIAREEDESLEYVLSNRSMLRVVKTLPRGVEALVRVMDGLKSCPVVRQRLEEFSQLLERAISESATATEPSAVAQQSPPPAASSPSTDHIKPLRKYSDSCGQLEIILGVNLRSGAFTEPQVVHLVRPTLVDAPASSSSQPTARKRGGLLLASAERDVEASRMLKRVRVVQKELLRAQGEEMKRREARMLSADVLANVTLNTQHLTSSARAASVRDADTKQLPQSLQEKYDLPKATRALLLTQNEAPLSGFVSTTTSSNSALLRDEDESEEEEEESEEEEGDKTADASSSFRYSDALATSLGVVVPPPPAANSKKPKPNPPSSSSKSPKGNAEAKPSNSKKKALNIVQTISAPASNSAKPANPFLGGVNATATTKTKKKPNSR